MALENCWDVKVCGRTSGGAKAAELGVCPAAIDTSADGLNREMNGGRICWAVTGTLCGGEVQGSFAQKQVSCTICEFYKSVKAGEGPDFKMMKPGQKFVKRA